MTATATKLPTVAWQGMVKVQLSVWTTEATKPQVRIYNQDRSLDWTGDAGADILRWFDEGELKFYAKAKLRGTVIHIIRKHREPRNW